jgi:type VI secretion system secreted protein Hcp
MSGDMYLKFSNGIIGEAQDGTQTEAVDIDSWSWAMSQSGTTHRGPGGGGGKVSVGDITINKKVDLASNDLIKRCASGEHIDECELIVRKAGGNNPLEFFRIKFGKVIISSYQTGGTADASGYIPETFTMNFRCFEITYTQQDEGGMAGTSASTGWDIAANQVWP